MQKNLLANVLGIGALVLLCSCGTGKKDEVKVETKDQTQPVAPVEGEKKEAGKEVASNEQQPATEAQAATEAQPGTAVAQAEAPAQATPAQPAAPAAEQKA